MWQLAPNYYKGPEVSENSLFKPIEINLPNIQRYSSHASDTQYTKSSQASFQRNWLYIEAVLLLIVVEEDAAQQP